MFVLHQIKALNGKTERRPDRNTTVSFTGYFFNFDYINCIEKAVWMYVVQAYENKCLAVLAASYSCLSIFHTHLKKDHHTLCLTM